jgi:DNA-binding transcriptional MerR regulator
MFVDTACPDNLIKRFKMTAARDRGYTIGALSRETGCKIPTIRYYEQIGLMPAPERTAGNQRLYDRKQLDRLAFVRHARELGFSLDSIRELLGLADDPSRSCEAADAIARAQLAQVENRIARLNALKSELERMVEQCRGGKIGDCRVIEVLADHSKCLTGDHSEPHAA